MSTIYSCTSLYSTIDLVSNSLFTYDHKNANITIPNIGVHGDLNIVLYHTRSNIVAKGKVVPLIGVTCDKGIRRYHP